MIKKAKKSVAVGLSVALAVTSVNIPTNSASAAAKKAKLSATKKTITAGKSSTLTLKTNKKKSTVIKSIVTKYVKVSTSKSSVATVKKVTKTTKVKGKKVTKVTGIKVTAKKAGKATITVKVTKGTYKGTYKCAVTVKAKPKATTTPTEEPTEEPTQEPTEEPTQEPTVEPATTPAITVEPATTPAITEEPIATPEVKATVTKASNITKEGNVLQVLLSFENDVTEAALKDTTITLTGAKTVTAKFAKIDATGKAVYEIVDEADIKALTPGDTTANGSYKVTSASEVLVLKDISAEYEEALAGNAVAGYVTTLATNGTDYVAVPNATVTIDGGQSVKTDANGYYKVASVNGSKKISVKADSFIDSDVKRVSVNRNHVTSQNFVMTAFDQNKVFANFNIVDETTTSANVTDATVTVTKADGTVVAEAVTDSNGKVSFGNNGASADLTASGDPNKKVAESWAPYFVKGQTYKVYVEKKISDTNLKDVFVKQQVGTITIGNKYNHNAKFVATRVKKTPSLAITQVLADNEVLAQVTNGDASNVNTAAGNEKMKAQYTVYTTVNGYMQKILAESTAVEVGDIANKSVATDIIAKITNLKDATLPTGNYFVVVNPVDAKSDSVRVSVAATKVVVTEGTAATASVTLTQGYLREFVTNVALEAAEEKAQGSFGEKVALKTVKNNNGTLAATSAGVKVKYNIYQVIDGENVPIKEIADSAVEANAKLAFVATESYNRLLSNGTYKITSASANNDYVVAVDKTESINNKTNGSVTYNTDSAWNLVEAKIKVAANSVLVTGAQETDLKLNKVVAKNVTTGKETVVFDNVNTPISVGAASASAVVAGTTELTYPIPASVDLTSGKYTFTYSIAGYKDVTSTEQTVVGLEEVSNSLEATLVKTTADATTIAGTITTKDDNGNIAKLDGTAAAAVGSANLKPLVMLLDKDGKLAALATIDGSGEYALVDKGLNEFNKIDGGTYKMIVRAGGYETKVVDVTVDANKTVTANIELEAGATGQIKAYVTDTANNPVYLTEKYYAYDKYYTLTADYASTSGKAASVTGLNLFTDYNIGAYKAETKGASDKTVVFDKLPAGTYTVKCGLNNALETWGTSYKTWEYAFEDKTVVLTGNGDKQYPEWQFAKTDSAGSNKVILSVKYDASAQTALKQTVSGDKVYAIAVTDQDGNLEAYKILKRADDSTVDPDKIEVTTNKKYTVTLYTESGYQVTSDTVNVQKMDTSVSLSVIESNLD